MADRVTTKRLTKACGCLEDEEFEIKDDSEDHGEEALESKKHKKDPRLYEPTAREVAEHNISHIPFRSWCQDCIMGQAVSDPHYKVDDDNVEEIPIISVDYMYLKAKEEEEEFRRESAHYCSQGST